MKQQQQRTGSVPVLVARSFSKAIQVQMRRSDLERPVHEAIHNAIGEIEDPDVEAVGSIERALRQGPTIEMNGTYHSGDTVTGDVLGLSHESGADQAQLSEQPLLRILTPQRGGAFLGRIRG